nr:hypothetical protein [Tanacetum cinerariifolium]
TMTTVNQRMSIEEIERVVAHRGVDAVEAAVAIYETTTKVAHKSRRQTGREEEEAAEAGSKKKWGSNNNGSLSQQNKGHKVPRAHTAWPINKKA